MRHKAIDWEVLGSSVQKEIADLVALSKQQGGNWGGVEENRNNYHGAPRLLAPRVISSNDNSSYTLVDVFSGAGGFSCGFTMEKFRPVLGIDYHIPSVKTFQINHPTTPVILGDIREISDTQILEGIDGRRVNVITAGIPCQGFSLLNRKRNPVDERNFLFVEFIRVVELLEPDFVVIENVTGMKSVLGGAFVECVERALRDIGFPYVDHRVLNAADYGVPQMRHRLFFIAGIYPFTWPERVVEKYTTVGEAFSDLPPLESGQVATEYLTEPLTPYQKLMRGNQDKLLNHEAPKHSRDTILRIANTQPGQPMYPNFKQRIRLRWDAPAPTLVSGGIRPQFFYGHPTQPRGLTIRERCRLMSFPDWYYIEGGIVQGRVQTGQACPPLLAAAIAKEIRKALDRGNSGAQQSEANPFVA